MGKMRIVKRQKVCYDRENKDVRQIMIFHGFQKMTMLDYPGHVACTLFTAGCNFRCPFCHNATLVTSITKDDLHTEEEILTYLRKRRGILDGVCITGGEPLMQTDLKAFIIKVKELGLMVKLDTNGSNPSLLKELIEEGLLDYVAMDIKNAPNKYALTAGLDQVDMEAIRQSVDILKGCNIPYEFRTTIVPEYHTASDIEEIAKWLSGCYGYFLQQFVDSGCTIRNNLHAYAPSAMMELLQITKKYVPNAQLRGV